MLPFLEVSHLPSSASFYSAILQPLGLVYISHAVQASELTPPASSSSSSSSSAEVAKQSPFTITYGTSSLAGPVLQLRQVTQPKRSHAVFAVSSLAAVAAFRSSAFRANPADPVLQGLSRPVSASITPDVGGEARCRITDLDRNTIELVYMPSSHHIGHEAESSSGRSTNRPTQDEPGRIISWDYDIAASESEQAPAPLAAPGYSNPTPTEPYSILRRSVTTSTIEGVPRESPTSAGNNSGATAILGAVLGAAAGAFAGAALTYGVMKSERERAPRQEFEAPPVTRRATFPDRLPDPRAAHAPAPYGGGGGRYVEVERTVEKIRYPEEYAPIAEHRPPPQYLAKYSQANLPASRALDDMYDDGRSHRSSRRGSRAPSTTRTRSAAPEAERGAPLMLMDHEHRSNVGSRHSTTRPPSARNQSYEPTDRDTYVSARSRRSASTVKGPPPPTVETELAVRSRAPSRVSSKAPSIRAPSIREATVVSVREPTTRPPSNAPSRAASKAASRAGPGTAVMMAGGNGGGGGMPYTFPPNASRTPSHVSARHIGLPMSGVGSSHAGWDDDNVSVAPSDSISCVGSKTSRRRYNP